MVQKVISVILTTFHTPPEILARTWASLKAQTYKDWNLVVWDDSKDDLTYRHLYGLCADDRYKVEIHRSHVHSGSVGQVKRRASMVATGDILVELDHDDELTPDCLEEIAKAFQDPEVGFAYSDWCEILPDGLSGKYPDGWAFGYGDHYWSEEHNVWVMKCPEVNRKTLSHIVSVPNHVRAWRASVYRTLNGHDPMLPVADDYELIIRTALITEMAYIPKMLYKQYMGAGTTQRQRNAQIQQLVAHISAQYAPVLDEEFGYLPNEDD